MLPATRIRKSFLRNRYRYAVDNSQTLLQTLEDLEDAQYDAVSDGLVLVSTSGNAHESRYRFPSGFDSGDIMELISDLIDRYEEAEAKLIADDEISSPTDAQIYTEMLARMKPIRDYQSDFSAIRTGPTPIDT